MKHLLAFSFILFSSCLQAQRIDTVPNVPLIRSIFHEKIMNAKLAIAQQPFAEGDSLQECLDYIYQFQLVFELDTNLSNNDKVKYLRGLQDVLTDYQTYFNNHKLTPTSLKPLLNAFGAAITAEMQQQTIAPTIAENNLAIGEILVKSYALQQNNGIAFAKELLVLKECAAYPKRLLPILSQNAHMFFVDSLLPIAAKANPDLFYNYAAATDKLGAIIRKNNDPLVKTIAQIATLKTGRNYFAFLDNIYSGKLTIATIDSIATDSIAYYKLLVTTATDYADRLRRRDTPMALKTLYTRLKLKAKETFINEINALHDSPNEAIRFKILEKLSAEELYYLCIMGEEEIYTSSYLGVYKRVFERMQQPAGDKLLMNVRFDHFRKWIKMAAGYNTLDDFFSKMQKGNIELLMKAFVNGLEKSGDLEDAVDVADSYASVKNKAIQQQILQTVSLNYNKAVATDNKAAKEIYFILKTIFASIDTANKIDVSAVLGIPPVYSMPDSLLMNNDKKIIIQQYFYGDKDGTTIYNAFLNNFRNGNWKVVQNDDFATVTSIKGRQIIIYSNRPLNENENLDAIAQANTNKYLQQNNLAPTIVIHRGHSYFLKSTLDQLSPSAKLVILGSCGGYNNLNSVLKICPEAHIIASKQVGTGLINKNLISTITEQLRLGKDLDWPKMWQQLGKTFASDDKFDDYVPPHKNLGAIFITAYKKLQNTTLQ